MHKCVTTRAKTSILKLAHYIINIPGKSRDQNLRVALYKCLISYTLETLVLSMPYDEEQIAKVSRLYLLKFVFSDTIYF